MSKTKQAPYRLKIEDGYRQGEAYLSLEQYVPKFGAYHLVEIDGGGDIGRFSNKMWYWDVSEEFEAAVVAEGMLPGRGTVIKHFSKKRWIRKPKYCLVFDKSHPQTPKGETMVRLHKLIMGDYYTLRLKGGSLEVGISDEKLTDEFIQHTLTTGVLSRKKAIEIYESILAKQAAEAEASPDEDE